MCLQKLEKIHFVCFSHDFVHRSREEHQVVLEQSPGKGWRNAQPQWGSLEAQIILSLSCVCRGWVCSSVEECLPSILEALHSSLSASTKKERKSSPVWKFGYNQEGRGLWIYKNIISLPHLWFYIHRTNQSRSENIWRKILTGTEHI